MCAALIAPFEARNCSSQALLVQSSVAHAHTIALPAADAAGAGFALGSWGGANEQSRPKFLLRFAAHPPDDAPVEWCDWLPVGREAPLALPRGDDEIVLLQLHATARRTAGCAHWHLELRAALTLHNTSARPLRAVVCGLPFFHSLPAGGSAPVEVWSVAARAQPRARPGVRCRRRGRRRRVGLERRARRRRGGGGEAAAQCAERARAAFLGALK